MKISPLGTRTFLLLLTYLILTTALKIKKQPNQAKPSKDEPTSTEEFLDQILKPYLVDASEFQNYVKSHPEEFQSKARDNDDTEYYVKGPAWVKLDKNDFNSLISRLKYKNVILNKDNLNMDDDKLFLHIEETNLFDGLP